VTLFALYRSPDDPTIPPQAVAERFSWFAALLPPVHALVHRLWDQLGLFLVGLVALVFGARYVGADATIWLYLLLAVACGFAAPGAERRAMTRRGLLPMGHRVAQAADLARLASMENRP